MVVHRNIGIILLTKFKTYSNFKKKKKKTYSNFTSFSIASLLKI